MVAGLELAALVDFLGGEAVHPDAADGARFFSTPDKWRQWLDKNHAKANELWVGYHKKGTGEPSMTWPQSVDK